jgi:hypothetical protein
VPTLISLRLLGDFVAFCSTYDIQKVGSGETAFRQPGRKTPVLVRSCVRTHGFGVLGGTWWQGVARIVRNAQQETYQT